MKASHVLDRGQVSGEVPDSSTFILANGLGSFLNIGSVPESRYNGWFFYNGKRMFKVLENVSLINSPGPSEVINRFGCFERKRQGIVERFSVPSNTNSLVYELSSPFLMKLDFDIRDANDFRQWGRNYEVFNEKDMIIVHFSKSTHHYEDSSSNVPEYSLYVAIKHDGSLVPSNRWVRRDYSFDRKRKSMPDSMHVFEALEGVAGKVVFSVSERKESAMREAASVFSGKNAEPYRLSGDDVAYECAIKSLRGLFAVDGLFAGFPWFFQPWARDEAVSAKALSKAIGEKSVKNLLLGRLNQLLPDGRTCQFGGKVKIGCADGIGWLALRVMELKLSPAEKKFVADKLEDSVKCLRKAYERDLLIFNSPLETWMDTSVGNDTREGFRIEIQAMQLAMYNALGKLTGKDEYTELETRMAAKVRSSFWNGKILADGLDDFTVRPNAFIAAYAYPQLLGRDEWSLCFRNQLQGLWLEWGGISSIDKKSALFHEEYSGEPPESYHRGDSWFWINNLAALVMSRVDRKAFSWQIKKIHEASTNDILWNGSIGNHSELSSAREQRAEGCLNQAWSSAMFIELCDELKKRQLE
ncbi:hypothetical protein HYU11_04560 [Candidatus Woesearchaeota archaeon]|nr:hypothetical protein [Candidatus Woesearchaeota archaeon]